MKSSLGFKVLVICAVLAINGLAAAQDPSGDPPSRVMRLQYVDGQVSLQPGGVDDWVAANLNRPLTTADRIWTDRDSHAELTMASAALRLGSETSVTVTNLDDSTAQIELDQGALSLSVRYLSPGEIVEVDTPNFAYTVIRPGEYRFDVLPNDDQSWITVRHGDGEATGQGNALRIRSGQSFQFSAGQSLSYTASGVPSRDGFDDWCAVREQRETSSPSASYVAAGTVGYEDLDDNGYWAPSPVYGNVWYPRVHAGWAPYREGHWAWVEPWGWTWVDDAPWGFAPFHYGRWVYAGDRWGWVPGPVGVRPVYAPALVAFVGGANFGVSIGIGGGGGGVGWFPLGWRDPYLPAYRVSAVYARNVNISNSRVVNITTVNNYYTTTNVNVRNTTINNIHYENATVNGAVTGVSSGTFASGMPVGRNSVVVPAAAVGRSSMMPAASVVPTKAAVLGGHAPVTVPARVVAPRQVVSKVAPPQRPVSFEQQRPLLQKSNGIPLSPQTRSDLRKSNPAPAPRAPQAANQPVGNAGQRGGNQPVGRPPVANQPSSNQTSGRTPAVNVPSTQHGTSPANPAAGAGHYQPNNPPNNNRPAIQPTPPANANQNGAPVRNVPRPQPGGSVNGQTQSPSRSLSTQNPGQPNPRPSNANREVTPARPVTPAATPHVAAPARPATPPPPPHNPAPARTVQPAPQGHKAPLPKDNKENEEKDKEPREH
jgi:hypothetical protein